MTPTSFLDDAAAHHHQSGLGAVETAAHVDVEDRAFAAAVLDPETRVKLVVEHHIDDDIAAGVTVVATCPGQDDVGIDLPVGDVAGLATLLIQSMREAGSVAEEAATADLTANIEQQQREIQALANLVLQWQNRKDGEPRPDASACAVMINEAQQNQERLDEINNCSLGEACAKLAATANL